MAPEHTSRGNPDSSRALLGLSSNDFVSQVILGFLSIAWESQQKEEKVSLMLLFEWMPNIYFMGESKLGHKYITFEVI